MKANIRIDRKNNKCTWETDHIRVVFSKPCVDTSTTVTHIRSLSEAMYFDYLLTVYVKVREYDEKTNDDKYRWRKTIDCPVGDFPTIEHLKWNLQRIINKEVPIEDYMLYKVDYMGEQGSYKEYRYHLTTQWILYDDFYAITEKIPCVDNEIDKNHTTYDLEFGQMMLSSGITNIVRVNELRRKDIRLLFYAVNEFINLAIKKHNDICQRDVEDERQNKAIKDNLLVYTRDGYRTFDIPEMDFYQVGDTFDTVNVFEKSPVNGEQIIRTYYGMHFEKIDSNDNTIVLNNPYKNETLKVSPQDIYTISSYKQEDNKELFYNVDEIINDFNAIIQNNNFLKEEFETKTIEELYKEYGMAIINRYWMCRDEHPYMAEKPEDMENIKYALTIVKEQIINKLKSK